MTVTKQHNGSWHIMDIVDGYLKQRVYYDYTRKEAVELFKQDKQE